MVAGAPGDSAQSSFVKAGAALAWCGSAEREESDRVSVRSWTGSFKSNTMHRSIGGRTIAYVSFQNQIKMVVASYLSRCLCRDSMAGSKSKLF